MAWYHWFVALVPLVPAFTSAKEADPSPPNFVLIFTDDQGDGDLGCFGCQRVRTPHIFLGLPYSHDIHPLNQPDKWDFPPLPLLEGEKVVAVDPDPDQFTRRFTDTAIEFIRAHRDEPFFVYLPHPLPHRPLHASEEFTAKLNPPPADDLPSYPKAARDRIYPAAIEEIDHNVGRIIELLDRLDLAERTLVVFTSDNGPTVGSSGPLRGGKGSALEGGVRVPCVARWAGRIPAGRTVDAVTSVMDWLPTFAAIAGAEVPTDRVIDGHDITPLLTGATDESPYRIILYYQGDRVAAARMGPWKLYHGSQLYNLETDIGERRNVAKEHPEIVARIRTATERAHRELLENRRPVGRVKSPRPLVPHSTE